MITLAASKFTTFWKLCALALLVTLWAILCGRISHPWTYNDDYNGAFWSQAARNFETNGYFTTAGIPAPLYFGLPPVPDDALYVHHPALLAAMMLVDHRMLGDGEWAARCLPILFSLATAAMLALFVAECLGWPIAVFSLAFFVAQPMEIHYGQMPNFEPPELFFLLFAAFAFYLSRIRNGRPYLLASYLCALLALWTDWQGYLLVLLLACHAATMPKGKKPAAGFILIAFFAGISFLLQIHLAEPAAWNQLIDALHERSSHSDLSGGTFTLRQWVNTEVTYVTSLYHPAALAIAVCGAIASWMTRRRLTPLQKVPIEVAAVFFLLDAIYVCALRNQSYIHDFASFYFLIPVSIFSGVFVVRFIEWSATRRPALGIAAAGLSVLLTLSLVFIGWRSLAKIDTQFCILDDDNSEPESLMPDLGRLIAQTFPPGAVVICNFDQYYSPLPFYARHEIIRAIQSPVDWKAAVADAAPHPAGGIIWAGGDGGADLVKELPPGERRAAKVDGISFLLWRPSSPGNPGAP